MLKNVSALLFDDISQVSKKFIELLKINEEDDLGERRDESKMLIAELIPVK